MIDERELQNNTIPYGHMTPDNVPIVGTVRPVICGRALHLLICLTQSNIAEAGTVSVQIA